MGSLIPLRNGRALPRLSSSRRERRLLQLWVLLGVLFMGERLWARPALRVQAEVSVESAQVLLGDVARFRGFSEEERRLAAAFRIGPAPMGGTTQQLPRAFLQARLRDAPLPPRTQLRLPPQLRLSRALTRVDEATLQAEVEGVVRAALGEGVQVRSVRLISPPPVSYPAGASLRLSLTPTSTARRIRMVGLRIEDGGRTIRAQQLRVEILEEVEALVLTEPLLPGRPLSLQSLTTAQVLSHELPRDALLSRAELSGAIARQRVLPPRPLRRKRRKSLMRGANRVSQVLTLSCVSSSPRSNIISERSRKLNLYRSLQRTIRRTRSVGYSRKLKGLPLLSLKRVRQCLH